MSENPLGWLAGREGWLAGREAWAHFSGMVND